MFKKIIGATRKVGNYFITINDQFQIRLKAGKYINDDLYHIFAGKRIALIGPADSSMSEKNGSEIDQYDLIVRLNKGYQLIENEKTREFIGSRTDVLFSRLDERDCLDPDTFDREILQKQGLEHLFGFMRTPGLGYYYRTVSFIEKFGNAFAKQLKILSVEKYRMIFNSLSGSKPSVGYIALYTLMESKATEIYVTGITFYLSGYQKGYRDQTSIDEQLNKFKRREDGHDPGKELVVFKEMVKKNRDRIKLDTFLKNHLESDLKQAKISNQ